MLNDIYVIRTEELLSRTNSDLSSLLNTNLEVPTSTELAASSSNTNVGISITNQPTLEKVNALTLENQKLNNTLSILQNQYENEKDKAEKLNQQLQVSSQKVRVSKPSM